MLKLYSSNFSLNLSFSLSLIKIGKFDWRQKFSYEQILKPADKSAQESTTPLTGLLAFRDKPSIPHTLYSIDCQHNQLEKYTFVVDKLILLPPLRA